MDRPVAKTLGSSVFVGILAFLGWFYLIRGPVPLAPKDQEETAEVETKEVILTEEKWARLRPTIAVVERRDWRSSVTLPGRLDYNLDRRVAIKSPVEGILLSIDFHPGERVKKGQVVATLSSPEVGRIRAEIKQRYSAVELANAKLQWHSKIGSGVTAIVGLIESAVDPNKLEEQLGENSLGDYREALTTAYARYSLARKMAAQLHEPNVASAISQRVVEQREAELQTAKAALLAAVEQSRFDAEQHRKEAQSAYEDARRQEIVAQQELATLLGPTEASEPLATSHVSLTDAASPPSLLSEVAVRAPFDGTIEERTAAANERIVAGQSLLVVADTSSLWAYADVRERDWLTMNTAIGEQVQLRSPAIPETAIPAKIVMVGRRVDPQSGVAPLIAELKSVDPRLRPGLFIRMTVETSLPRKTLVVPEQAVVVHENQAFVFRVEDKLRFRRVDVRVGESRDGWIELLDGIDEGTQIVTTGSFVLKSELLLSQEAD